MNADWRPAASIETLRLRADLKRRARRFFNSRGLLEVDTPALSAAGTTDPAIDSLSTRLSAAGNATRWLHTSPEFPMKRLLAAGSGDIWQICTVFRDGEAGRRHNPEFTMVEWYRLGWDHHRLASEVVAFVAELLDGHRPMGAPVYVSYRDAFVAHAGVDPFDADVSALQAALIRHGIPPPAGAMNHDGLLDLLMGTVVAPGLGDRAGDQLGDKPHCPVVVGDYPASQAALARVAPGSPAVAERFEVFVDGMEIANGFHELCDTREQRRRFEADLGRREQGGSTTVSLDERLLAALENGMAPCSGVAVGFDRVVMLAAGARTIRDVIAFPHDIA